MTISLGFTPMFAITTGEWNFTYTALRKSRECVIAVPAVDLLDRVVGIGTCSGTDTDKFAKFRLATAPPKFVKAPLVKDCLAIIECKVIEIPYDFLRRRLTIVVAENDVPSQHIIITKGAFANVLDVCSSQDRDGVEVPLDAQRRAELEKVFKAKGAEGFRVLAVATRKVPAKVHFSRDDEQDMTFPRLSCLSGPAQSGCTTHDPRSEQARNPHKGHQWR